MLSSSTFDAGLAEKSEPAAVGVVVDQLQHPVERQVSLAPRRGCAWILALATEICGSTPEAEVITASGGTSAAVRPAV